VKTAKEHIQLSGSLQTLEDGIQEKEREIQRNKALIEELNEKIARSKEQLLASRQTALLTQGKSALNHSQPGGPAQLGEECPRVLPQSHG